MKKIVLALVVLMFAASAWADVKIYCTDLGDGKVLVSFDATITADPNLVRGFGLNIQCDNDANIVDVNDNINPDYWVFPGTIIITGNVVTYKGTAVGEVGDSPDTLPGPPDSNGVTIEMASLYYPPDGPGSPNAPDPCAPLLTFTVDKATCITITGNVARAGSTGVVMENPDDNPQVNLTGVCVVLDPLAGTCWGAADCPGQTLGDATCDGKVNVMDVLKVKQSWLKNFGQPGFNQCADMNRDCKVNVMDILKVKQNWLASGLGGNLTAVSPVTCP